MTQRSFQLASFILQDRPSAIRAVQRALNKLKVQHNREQRRSYWRDKHLKGNIRRVARQSADALQWLVYFESEEFEKEQEESGQRPLWTLIISYIKHLVQISTPLSAFYVSVGLHRLLHNYSTPEVQLAYECVTEHYPGSQEYRRVKSAMMAQLQQRFGSRIQTVTGLHREVRFASMERQERYIELVDQCLRLFTPWSTRQNLAVPAPERTAGEDPLAAIKQNGIDPDKRETYRCHVFIDPAWFEFITEKLDLDPPHQRLSLPRFSFDTDVHNQDIFGVTMPVPELTNRELDGIFDYLSQEESRRQHSTSKALRVIAHGIEYARLHADDTAPCHCELPEGVKLVELWVEQEGGDVLIATHWVSYTEWLGIAESTEVINLGNNREIELAITPAPDHPGSASLVLSCRPAATWRSLLLLKWRRALMPRGWLLQAAFAGVSMLVVGWILGTFVGQRELSRQQSTLAQTRRQLNQEKALRESLQQQLTQHGPAPADVYRLGPDDLHVRTNEPGRAPVVHLSPGHILVTIELPVTEKDRQYKAVLTEFLKHQEILSESFAGATQRGTGSTIDFQLPSSLVHDGQYYVITVTRLNNRGAAETYRTFTFLVLGQ